MEGRKLPKLAYNWISTIGALVAAITGLAILFLLALNIFAHLSNPYLGIFIFMVLPPFFIFGLILIPIGMLRTWSRWKKTGEIPTLAWPYIDLNKSSHRNAFFIFVVGTLLFVTITAIGSYQGYHYTESVTFCGKTCHVVMNPEYTAYQNSPHARVACVSCHVGPGAGWYTKSKLSGLYQVYAVLAKVYPKPIPTPVRNLRPAQETCEECHWPRQFYGAQQRQFNHYKYDQANTYWPINMLLKTGGGDPKSGQVAGIHWHMNIGFKVEYIPRDEKRQDIPWVRVTDNQTGRITIYQDTANPLPQADIDKATPRIMDCMDCHNRPSHIYHSPDYCVDLAILTGQIDSTLPDVKKVAVETMAKEYESEQAAILGIANSMTDYYRLNYADLYAQKRVMVDNAVLAVQKQFSQNIFPFMKVRWDQYPNNIGHFTSVGCMRCHLGNHKSADGVTLTHECNACHIFLSQGSGQMAQVSATQMGLDFQHPEDIGEIWKETGCYECHKGVQP